MSENTAEAITIAETTIEPGEHRRLEIPVSRMATETWVSLPVEVRHGKRSGPCLWLSAAIHGDEVNGVEIIRRVLEKVKAEHLAGTLLSVPIVNVFGFLQKDRYLPDRRDLNRSFPGSANGSLAARLAHLMMREIVSRCTHGIDFHTGSHLRTNLPQIRGNLAEEETRRCAQAFAAPLMVHSTTRDGSLREAAGKRGITTLVFEGGEPLRFEERIIQVGVRGVLRVMKSLGMLDKSPKAREMPREITSTTWARAKHSGIFRRAVELGQEVAQGELLGLITDAFGETRGKVVARVAGVVLGFTTCPLIHQGEAVIHLGSTETT